MDPMKRIKRIPPQVIRILLLAAGIVSSYGMARYFLTPPSFGEYGFYRGAAIEEATALPIRYAGQQSCAECHVEAAELLLKHDHKSLSCEACHGPGYAHTQDLDVGMQKLHYSHCVRCHEANVSRPKEHKQVVTRDHYPGSMCTECHVAHAPLEVP
jgi:hypothetical protein